MRRHKHSILTLAGAALATLALVAARPANADGYTLLDLGTVPGYSGTYEWQESINDLGHVAFYANNGDNPNTFAGDISFLWESPTKTRSLPGLPNSTDTIVFGLNDLDVCVGISNDLTGSDHAVLWKHSGVQALGELPGDEVSAALFINNYGEAVGFSANVGQTVLHPVLWKNGDIIALPPLTPFNTYTQCTSINDTGDIIGYSGTDGSHFHGVLWSHGTVTDLGSLGGPISFPYSINEAGVIVGQSQTSATNFDSFDPVVWVYGNLIDLHNYGSDAYGVALSINLWGQIVGASGPSVFDAFTTHALLWENGAVINLQEKIPSHSGWTLQAATGINLWGEIAGFGLINGEEHAFLLIPK